MGNLIVSAVLCAMIGGLLGALAGHGYGAEGGVAMAFPGALLGIYSRTTTTNIGKMA